MDAIFFVPVERPERHRDMLIEFCTPALPRMARCGSFRALLAKRFACLQPSGRHWLVLAVDGRLYDQIATVRKKTGRNPTDRGKQGVKRSLLTDAKGLPMSLVVAAANTHDIKLVADTLDALQTRRPGKKLRLCPDKAYEAGWLKTYLQSRRYEPHIQSRKQESDASKNTDFKAHRWIVERADSWMNRFVRVLTRWEKKTENYEAILHIAFCL